MMEAQGIDKLQPALLDRLTDNEPFKKVESRENRVISMRRLRESVLRDLSWLLNSRALDFNIDSSAYPLVNQTVLNYGIPDLTGTTASSVNLVELERKLKEVICAFEPRLADGSLKVRAVMDKDCMNRNAIAFEIEGNLWARPIPITLYLKTELDLESGEANLIELAGRI